MATCAACGYEAAGTFRFCPECGARADAHGREQRKVVTVLFCDVVGSTGLGESRDAEAVRALLADFFRQAKGIVERHGGIVEKFIGDAVMAVFGLPAAHEDDALRALRAATEIQAALPALGIRGRIGVSSGEVVTGTEERLATGDAVNVAARLQQAAEPDEILLGQATLRLAGDAVDTEPLEPLSLKGKAEPVPAWRLVAVSPDAPQRGLDKPLIGREPELDALAAAWERARAGVCDLVTLVGAAGVGKSRLVEEFLAGADATVVRGRCLSYGEGVTYWPVVNVVKQLELQRAGIALDPAADDALAVLLGESGTSSPDDIAWGFRKLLEAVAAARPLIVVLDDIHWGEDVFLDLVEHVALLSTGAPILLLCLSRPELLDRRSGWGGVLRLNPLGAEQAEALMAARLGTRELDDETCARILQAAGGNPLFVEEMAAMIQTVGSNGEIEIPPTIQALLASRLDQLDGAERAVLERGAVEGELFHQGALSALTPDEPRLGTRLTALVRKEFVRPDRPQFAGTDAFRFRHLLVRDAAYEALPKAERAELHERFADWLEEHGHDLVERDELVGYHLEQAYRYLETLGRVDEQTRGLAARAAGRLAAAGGRAILRDDFRAGLNLLERAAGLFPPGARPPRFEVDLAWARFSSGKIAEATSGLDAAAERSADAGDRVSEVALRLEKGSYDLLGAVPGTPENQRRLAAEALTLAEAAGDAWALMVVHASLTILGELEGRPYAELTAAAEHVVACARRADDPLWIAWGENSVASFQEVSETPVAECLRWLEEHPHVERRTLRHRVRLVAMLGRFDEAHTLLAEAMERAAEIGGPRHVMTLALRRADVASLKGDWTEAEAAAREACEAIEASGELVNYLMFCCLRAEALLELGRAGEAARCLDRAEEIAPSVERDPTVRSRLVRARLLAGAGELVVAERLARSAVARADETDMPNLRGDAHLGLAHVLALAGQDPRTELERALANYQGKGNLVMAERTRALLAEASAPT